MAITTETPFQQWARLVKTRANGHLGETNTGTCATTLHRQIQKALGEDATPNLPTIRGWLEGVCVPATPAIHTALMNALNLPETMEEAYPEAEELIVVLFAFDDGKAEVEGDRHRSHHRHHDA